MGRNKYGESRNFGPKVSLRQQAAALGISVETLKRRKKIRDDARKAEEARFVLRQAGLYDPNTDGTRNDG